MEKSENKSKSFFVNPSQDSNIFHENWAQAIQLADGDVKLTLMNFMNYLREHTTFYVDTYGTSFLEDFVDQFEKHQQKEIKALIGQKKDCYEKKKEEEIKIKEKPPPQVNPLVTVVDTNSGGGYNDRSYSWTQELNDVELRIHILNFKKSDYDITFNPNQISICHKQTKKQEFWKNWSKKFKFVDSWYVFEKDYVVVHLTKLHTETWDSIFEGEPKIDPSKVLYFGNIHELDEETKLNVDKSLDQKK